MFCRALTDTLAVLFISSIIISRIIISVIISIIIILYLLHRSCVLVKVLDMYIYLIQIRKFLNS